MRGTGTLDAALPCRRWRISLVEFWEEAHKRIFRSGFQFCVQGHRKYFTSTPAKNFAGSHDVMDELVLLFLCQVPAAEHSLLGFWQRGRALGIDGLFCGVICGHCIQ